MRKHYKIITSIVCLVLCCCMVAFGVYAATNATLTVTSTVSFHPSNAILKIIGAIDGCKEKNDSSKAGALAYYGCNKDNVATGDNDTFTPWNFGTINFDEDYESAGHTAPDNIKFYIQVTNLAETKIWYTLKITGGDEKIDLNVSRAVVSNSDFNPTVSGYFDIAIENKPTALPVGTRANETGLTLTEKSTPIEGSEGASIVSHEVTFGGFLTDSTPCTTMIIVELAINEAALDNGFDNAFNFNIDLTASITDPAM